MPPPPPKRKPTHTPGTDLWISRERSVGGPSKFVQISTRQQPRALHQLPEGEQVDFHPPRFESLYVCDELLAQVLPGIEVPPGEQIRVEVRWKLKK